ncbi:MAG: sugar MFS transporter [Pseudarcicella sp.]|nr:sugar MFS transporter [Pseudarcicella sp.]MBP6411452.1 sugar MFS transporter [Pseudarcicella sp.]
MKETNHKIMPLVILGILFFTFGYITWTNSSLIPFLKIACQLQSDSQAFLVASAFYLAYFFLPIPSSWVLKKIGFLNGMIVGLLVVVLGSLVFIPAANMRDFNVFLLGLFLQGTGLALLQTAVNPYISIIGPIESAAKRISIMGICNKIAGMLAPIVLGGIVLNKMEDFEKQLKNAIDISDKNALLDGLAQRIITPYILLSVGLLIVAAVLWLSKLPEIKEEEDLVLNDDKTAKKNVFQFPNLVFGALAIVFYVAAEVIAGDGIGQYGKNIGISLDEAKLFPAYTLSTMLIGYVLGILFIPKYISQENALKWSAMVGIIFTMGVVFTSGYVSVLFIALMGLSNALMWPAIFPLGIKGLGKFTKIGSAIMIMGIGPGGGIIPLLYSWLAGKTSPQMGFIVMGLCYVYILFFAVYGHKKKSW